MSTLKCIEIECSPIDESLPLDQYYQKMMKDVQDSPMTIERDGKPYSAVDTFFKRMEGDLAIWSTIYCDKPEDYDVNNRPAAVREIMDESRKAYAEQKRRAAREALDALRGKTLRILGFEIEDCVAYIDIKPLGDSPQATLTVQLTSDIVEFLSHINHFPHGAVVLEDGNFMLLPF